jgi:uncharacterized protein
MTDQKDECELILADLHTEVDLQAGHLNVLHAKRLQCRKGCCSCCVDGLTVFEVEAENIRRHQSVLLSKSTPHPEGACAFLDEAGACRIYEHRPYVCRTQGLPLRWVEERSDGNSVELRDICPLNESGLPLETMPAEECWSIGPFEEWLVRLQALADGGKLRRVPLRSLFVRR